MLSADIIVLSLFGGLFLSIIAHEAGHFFYWKSKGQEPKVVLTIDTDLKIKLYTAGFKGTHDEFVNSAFIAILSGVMIVFWVLLIDLYVGLILLLIYLYGCKSDFRSVIKK